MTVRIAILGLALVASCGLATAAEIRVCVDDRVGLDSHTIRAFERELALLGNTSTDGLNSCKVDQGGTVRLLIRPDAPPGFSSALGLAHRRQARILPVLELYVNPVVKLLGPARVPSFVGRALARVAAHELQHYQTQTSVHSGHGLMQSVYTERDLTGDPPSLD